MNITQKNIDATYKFIGLSHLQFKIKEVLCGLKLKDILNFPF